MSLSHDEARFFLRSIGYKFGGARGGLTYIVYKLKSPTDTQWREFNIQDLQTLANRLYKMKVFL